MVIVRPNPAPRERPGGRLCGPLSGWHLLGLRRWHVALRANFGPLGRDCGRGDLTWPATSGIGAHHSPRPSPHDGQNRRLGRRRQMRPAGDDGTQVGVFGSQCRRVTPTSTPTCCLISGFARGIRWWPLDCKSAIVGSTPTGASSPKTLAKPRKARVSRGFLRWRALLARCGQQAAQMPQSAKSITWAARQPVRKMVTESGNGLRGCAPEMVFGEMVSTSLVPSPFSRTVLVSSASGPSFAGLVLIDANPPVFSRERIPENSIVGSAVIRNQPSDIRSP
jgi:hypothetical protein